MSPTRSSGGAAADRVATAVTAILGGAAAVVLVYWTPRALSAEDTEALESPLLMSVARQLVAGPWGLYGPFGGENPLVLIHAPLYYRLAALVAWPIYRAGWDPVTAALVASRSLSAISLVATLWLAGRFARFGGYPPRAGWWASLLVAAAPILGGMPFAVRPDLVGVALQTAGMLLVVSALRDDRPGVAKLLGAFAAFGLAVCVKQHDVGVALVGTALLLAAWLRGRIGLPTLACSLLVAPAIVLAVFCAEQRATGGWMSRAVFQAAAHVGRVHPADWGHVQVVGISVLGKTIGLVALLTAARLAILWARAGFIRQVVAAAGTILIAMLAALMLVQLVIIAIWTFVEPSQSFADRFSRVGALNLQLGILTTAVILPACMLLIRRPQSGEGVDAALWACVAMELAIVTALARLSTGAWANYAIEAVVILCVLAARAMARAFDEAPPGWLLLPGALAVLITALVQVGEEESVRSTDRIALAEIFHQVKVPRSAFFFVNRPGLNRLDGRADLVYDDWLYPAFESIGLAEPRTAWLTRALTSGPVQVVVTPSDRPRVDGIETPLTRLRYRPRIHVGPFFVWVR
jgi:hypothetical protein